MPVIQKQVIVASGAVNENILQGSAFEFLRGNAIVSIGAVSAQTDAFVTIQSGADIILEEAEMAVKTTYPIIPDDMYYNDVGVQGDRLVVRIRNDNVVSSTMRVLVQLTNL